MSRQRRYSGPPRRHYAYAELTDQEFVVAKAAARAAGLTMSDFVRRCINSYLLEGGEDVPLLQEHEIAPRRAGVSRGTSDTVGPVGVSDLSGVSRHDG